jgi:hypothetical protein
VCDRLGLLAEILAIANAITAIEQRDAIVLVDERRRLQRQLALVCEQLRAALRPGVCDVETLH